MYIVDDVPCKSLSENPLRRPDAAPQPAEAGMEFRDRLQEVVISQGESRAGPA